MKNEIKLGRLYGRSIQWAYISLNC
jgi:hypothetical protein